MADNDTYLNGSGSSVSVAMDDIGGVKYPRVKLGVGVDGSARDYIGKCTPYKLTSAATNNAQSVKASAGYLHSIQAANINAGIRYLKLYNKASAPSPAADNALLVAVIPLPANGLPVAVQFGDHPLEFTTGIAIAIVTGASDTDNTATAANEQFITLGYN